MISNQEKMLSTVVDAVVAIGKSPVVSNVSSAPAASGAVRTGRGRRAKPNPSSDPASAAEAQAKKLKQAIL
jgi:hypothetical protein